MFIRTIVALAAVAFAAVRGLGPRRIVRAANFVAEHPHEVALVAATVVVSASVHNVLTAVNKIVDDEHRKISQWVDSKYDVMHEQLARFGLVSDSDADKGISTKKLLIMEALASMMEHGEISGAKHDEFVATITDPNHPNYQKYQRLIMMAEATPEVIIYNLTGRMIQFVPIMPNKMPKKKPQPMAK